MTVRSPEKEIREAGRGVDRNLGNTVKGAEKEWKELGKGTGKVFHEAGKGTGKVFHEAGKGAEKAFTEAGKGAEKLLHDAGQAILHTAQKSSQEQDSQPTKKTDAGTSSTIDGIVDLMSTAFGRSNSRTHAISHEVQVHFSKPKIFMEVLTSHQSRLVLMALYIICFIAFANNMVLIALEGTLWKVTGGTSNNSIDYTLEPDYFMYYSLSLRIFLLCCLTVTVILFIIHYHHRTTESTLEQKWTYVLLCTAFILVFPVRSIMYLTVQQTLPQILFDYAQSGIAPTFVIVGVVHGFVSFSAFVGIVFGYILTTLRSYSTLDDTISRRFILKIAYFGVIYIVFRILAYTCFTISLGETFFVSLIVGSRLETMLAGGLPWVTWTIIATNFTMECFVILWVAHEILRTRRFLQTINYTKYRSKQIGFQLFVHQFEVTGVVIAISSLAYSASRPLGLTKEMITRSGLQYIVVLGEDLATPILFVGFCIIQACLHLPADISGLFSLKRDTERDMEIQEKMNVFKLTTVDPRDPKRGLILNPRTFSLETQVLMLNCAFMAYNLFKSERENQDFSYFGDEDHKIVKKYTEDKYDTHAVLIESEERIIVAFRGTATSKNVQSDIDFKSVRLSTVYEYENMSALFRSDHVKRVTELDRTKEGEISKLRWHRAGIHRGFSTSYSVVRDEIEADVMGLYKKKKRIVYVCGHSLGGALATLFAFGLPLRNHCIYESGISLTTFGSPRVGNRSFAKLFEQVVHNYWRVVNTGDLVTKIPGANYRHVGTRVLLTMHSEMFIDPCYFEFKWWHKNVNKTATHRLPSYYMSLRSYVETYVGDDKLSTCGFWEWDLNSNIKKMYQHNLYKKCTSMDKASGNMNQEVTLWRNLVAKAIAREAGIEL